MGVGPTGGHTIRPVIIGLLLALPLQAVTPGTSLTDGGDQEDPENKDLLSFSGVPVDSDLGSQQVDDPKSSSGRSSRTMPVQSETQMWPNTKSCDLVDQGDPRDQRDGSMVKVLTAKPGDLSSTPETTWWKESTNKLSCDLTHANPHTNT